MLRKAFGAVGALLVLFHIWLFAGQMWAGELVDAALIGRWAVAGGLAAALFGLHRRGLSIVRGRPAVAIWLLAALLHAPAAVERLDAPIPAVPEAVAVLVSAATLATGMLLLAALFSTRRAPVQLSRRTADVRVPADGPAAVTFLVLAPRPPPVA